MVKRNLIAGLPVMLLLVVGISRPEAHAQSASYLDLSSEKMRERVHGSAYLSSRPIPAWGWITGTKDAGVNLSEGETVYVQLEPEKGVKPGDRFSIMRLGRTVVHPLTREKYGRVIILCGELTILDRRDHIVPAKINKSYRPVLQGDLLLPAESVPPPRIPFRMEKKIEGVILASLDDAQNITEKEIVFIDRGSDDGVIQGDVFSVYQLGHFPKAILERGTENLPLIKVGEAVVVAVQPASSTAFVTYSPQAIYVGDKVVSGRN